MWLQFSKNVLNKNSFLNFDQNLKHILGFSKRLTPAVFLNRARSFVSAESKEELFQYYQYRAAMK